MLRHPAEPNLPFTGGFRAVRARDESLLPWMERTLERARVYGPAHLLLARAFRGVSPSQARLEYRTAFEQAPELVVSEASGLNEALLLVHRYEDAKGIIPHGEQWTGYLDLLIGMLGARLPATAARLEEDLELVDPRLNQAVWRRARQALADLRAGDAAPWCSGDARKACGSLALEESLQAERADPTLCEGFLLRAQVLVEVGDARRGAQELDTASERVVDRPRCLKELAQLATSAKVDDVVTHALDQLTHLGCAAPPECVGNLRFVASVERARGNPRRALAVLQQAHEQAPEDDAMLVEIAQLASTVQLHGEAVEAYTQLARRHPAEAQWRNAAAQERAAAVQRDAHP